ncbi:MAG: ferrochelatase [Vampirovibrio sp.]
MKPRLKSRRLVQTIPLVKAFQSYDLPTAESKIGILFFNLGGPDDQDSVQPFLQNLFKDNDIIQLPVPQWIQNIFAWRVSRKRKKEAQGNYAKIGGGSPILKLTRQQIDLVQAQLAPAFEARGFRAPRTYLAMRYWHPFLKEALSAIEADGITHLMLLPLYPHYCLATTGSSFRELAQLMGQAPHQALAETVNIATICSYYKEPRFLEAQARRIQQSFDQKTWSVPPEARHIVFSAHGIPQKYAVDNQDPYPTQIKESCAALMAQYFPENTWDICWQSRVGPLEWLKPYTEDHMEVLAHAQRDNVLMVPISFVSDHIETLFEMDMLYVPIGEAHGLSHWHRAESLNDDPVFIELLSELCLRLLERPLLCKIRWPESLQNSASDLPVPLPVAVKKVCASAHSQTSPLSLETT